MQQRRLPFVVIESEPEVAETAPWARRTLAKSGLREQGVMVVSIRRASGDLLMPPGPNDEVRVGDCLMALGKIEAISALLS